MEDRGSWSLWIKYIHEDVWPTAKRSGTNNYVYVAGFRHEKYITNNSIVTTKQSTLFTTFICSCLVAMVSNTKLYISLTRLIICLLFTLYCKHAVSVSILPSLCYAALQISPDTDQETFFSVIVFCAFSLIMMPILDPTRNSVKHSFSTWWNLQILTQHTKI